MKMKVVFFGVLLLTLSVYVMMVAWSLPYISRQADNLPVFDLRLLGYSFEEAKAFLTALKPGGKAFYLSVQHWLDTAFPFLFALSVGFSLFLLLSGIAEKWRLTLSFLGVPGMIFDYLENGAVGGLLRAGADNITPEMVAEASFYSQMKALFVTIALTMILVLVLMRFIKSRRS